jgi:hypothetical protein
MLSKLCSGHRQFPSTRSFACRVHRAEQCKWRFWNSTSPGVSIAMPETV